MLKSAEKSPPNANELKKDGIHIDYGRHRHMTSKCAPVPLGNEVLKEQNLKLIHPRKNFISKNVKAATRMKPKESNGKIVVDCMGTTKEARLHPEYINSEIRK
ncbi:hypothetical protein QE152_g21733 [Popillia japonica]|uniref:Uncharacterized protein n=1 Tax=Popillia japonica TaxID=7064 RepID=A0AAW1KN10_POPJA